MRNTLAKTIRHHSVLTLLAFSLSIFAVTCKRGETGTPLERITKLIEENPKVVQNYYVRAHIYELEGIKKLAREDYTRIIQIDSTAKNAYHARGMIYFFEKYYPEALRDFSRAIAIDSTWGNPYTMRAWCYEKLRNFDAAVIDLNRCIRLDSGDSLSLPRRAEDLRILGRYEEAISDYKRLADQQERGKFIGDLRLTCVNLCEMLSAIGKNQEALDYINKAIAPLETDSAKFREYDSYLLYYRGLLNYRLGKYEQAMTDL